MPAEILPVGVGRVPLWWMEITPHYVLDEDDEEQRRLQEDQMAFYYMQLAAADDAGILGPDGRPALGADLKEMEWTPVTPWNGRSAKEGGDAAGHNNLGPGGRNFKPGQPVIDPKLFGILESDPDYKDYLTGAKLPPGYFEKMGELASKDKNGSSNSGIQNNLNQTDYGRYGRQAEKPTFKPAWAKKKLKGTAVGANIRQGQYDDSPNKHIRRRVEPADNLPSVSVLDDEPPFYSSTTPMNPADAVHAQIKAKRYDDDNDNQASTAPAAPEEASSSSTKKKMVRKVRKVRKKEEAAEPAEQEQEQQQHKRYEHSDYYHNANQLTEQQQKLKEQQEKLARLKELQRQQQLLKEQQEREAAAAAAQQQQQEVYHHHHDDEEEYDEESIIEEEYEDEEEYTEGSYEEEVIDDDDDGADLGDLQAILAAKQAELQRLQGQL